MSTPPYLTKGNNFCDLLFASLGDKTLSKRGQLLGERTCFLKVGKIFSVSGKTALKEVHLFLQEQDPVTREAKTKIAES